MLKILEKYTEVLVYIDPANGIEITSSALKRTIAKVKDCVYEQKVFSSSLAKKREKKRKETNVLEPK